MRIIAIYLTSSCAKARSSDEVDRVVFYDKPFLKFERIEVPIAGISFFLHGGSNLRPVWPTRKPKADTFPCLTTSPITSGLQQSR